MKERLRYALIQNTSQIKKRIRFNYKKMITPVRDMSVIFECYHGKRYADNVKAIYEAMLADERFSNFHFIWAFSDVEAHRDLEEKPRTIVVKKGSHDYFFSYANSRFWVNNVSIPDFLKPGRNHIYIETWHGTPLKKLGCDITADSDPRQSPARMHRRYRAKGKKIDVFLSPSRFYSEKLSSAFHLDPSHREKIMCEVGYPRNDGLFHYTVEGEFKIKERLNIPLNKKVLLYAPTWRDTEYTNKKGFNYIEALDTTRLMQQLGDDYILLFRAHHQVGLSHVIKDTPSVIDVTDVDDINELYIISDLMITDYSSTMFDYANLKRPMVYYMYDLEQYENEIRGFYLNLNELPGPIIDRQEQLADAIRQQMEHFQYDKRYQDFNDKFNPLDDGYAAKRVLDQIIYPNISHKRHLWERFIIQVRRYKNKFHLLYILGKYNWQGFLRKHGLALNNNFRRLRGMKDMHKGERCFLIGNGPSLNPDDLNRLKNEYTFGTNMVYKIFDQTDWRPTYHCVSDSIYGTRLGHELYDNVKSPLFTLEKTYRVMRKRPIDTTYLSCFPSERYKVRGNPLAYVMVKATVLSLAAEIAFHMGFKEIYLLGVDCTNPHASNGHFIADYSSKEVAEADLSRIRTRMKEKDLSTEAVGAHIIDRSMDVYRKLDEYATKHGVRIYNATRGGNLEIFERVDFDDIVQ